MAEQVPKTAQDTAPHAATTTTTTTTTTTEEVDVVADVVVQDSSHSTPPPPPLPENENEKEKETDDETEKQKLENEKEKLEKEKEREASPLPRPLPETEAETDQEEKQPALNPDTTESYDDKIPESGSFFKEESTRLSDLPDPDWKALHDLKLLVREALHNHLFSSSSSSPKTAEESQDNDKEKEKEKEKPAHEKEEAEANIKAETAPAKKNPELEEEPEEVETSEVAVHHVTDDDGAKTVEAIEETIVAVSAPQPKEADKDTHDMENKTKDESLAAQSQFQPQPQPQEVCIWGIPLLADDRSDVILLKFLRARDLKVKDAFTMLKNTISWRKEFGIDQLVEVEVEEESNRSDLEKAVFMHGQDKEGHPVCYNVFGEFQNKELYQKTFSDEEKRQKFLRWRIQFLERSIRKLDFSPGGVCTIVQVNDLHNSPGPSKWELRQATKQALHLLQDNYPEFVAKQVFINVPWWYMAVNRMISPFLTQRTKSKFVFAGPSKSAQTLLRYIGAEQIPVKYGGLSKDGEFDATDAVTEITLRPAAKHTVEFPATERCVVSWEVRVGGGEVKYGAEFVPSAEESYTVIIQKTRKLSSSRRSSSAAATAQDHPLPVVSNSFKIGEPGKISSTDSENSICYWSVV
ncbi:hypothetical protein TIFTF001_001490 [Ficus carica]|uniref:CRAL-TRIO domain-containing protein n=1 Tax=Ficus carica TaxID=3494 RepID=A0AA87Z0B8_FICCA|nr:hypothetical protein TIFTF001_001490 [Ficus carica]